MLEAGSVLQAGGREYRIVETLGKGASTTAFLAQCRDGELNFRCILKEYTPSGGAVTREGIERFLAAGKLQNQIRQDARLSNPTPPVSHIFEANGTAFLDVVCFQGKTLDKLPRLPYPQRVAVCETVARMIGYYHSAGYLCLDLKPQNLFIPQNAPEDTLTQLVEMIDFDSVRSFEQVQNGEDCLATREWSAPEQRNPYTGKILGPQTDLYALGELCFWLTFGRHSLDSEHRGFSRYPFEECEAEVRKYTDRPAVQSLLTEFFHGTLRSSAQNRFQNAEEAEAILQSLREETLQKDYVVPRCPAVSPHFVGREREIKAIGEKLARNPVLFLTGVGGIGKTTLAKNFIQKNKTAYDVICYLESGENVRDAFSDDFQLQLSRLHRGESESLEAYFPRKLGALRKICAGKRVLMVIDNFTGEVSKDLNQIFDCGFETLVCTRRKPPKNSFAVLEITAIPQPEDLFRLISLNLGRAATREERECFLEIIRLVQGHTLVLELIARQMAAGNLDAAGALRAIQERGFSRFSDEKIESYKDGELLFADIPTILSALFDAGSMTREQKRTLHILSLLDPRGLEEPLLRRFFPDMTGETLRTLERDGWIYGGERIRVHPVIAQTVSEWPWDEPQSFVMCRLKTLAEIYSGMSDSARIRVILDAAENYTKSRGGHFSRAVCYDILGTYYDTLLDGNYAAQTEREKEYLQKLIDSIEQSIREMECSGEPLAREYLSQYEISLAGVLLRGVPRQHARARDLLRKAAKRVEETEPEDAPNRCYLLMTGAWYCTLARKNLTRTRLLTARARELAETVFPTDLERVDIVMIPTANCFYYHGEYDAAAETLREAIAVCERYHDTFPYLDKRQELYCCLLDVLYEAGDFDECKKIIFEIDSMNEQYRERGVCRMADPAIREALEL